MGEMMANSPLIFYKNAYFFKNKHKQYAFILSILSASNNHP